jgi:hypothetical protein
MSIFTLALCIVVAAGAQAQTTAPATPASQPASPQCHALIVSGLPGSNLYGRRFSDWQSRLAAHLAAAGVPRANIVLLHGDKDAKDPACSTGDNLRAAVRAIAVKAQPQDQFIFAVFAHGTVPDVSPALVLPGPDVGAPELADLLNSVKAGTQVVLMLGSSSGDFVKPLARRDRVLLTATSPGEGAEPVFAEFFLRGLESKRCDGESVLPKPAPAASASAPASAPALPVPAGVKDDVLTVLEAYNWATHQTAMWMLRQKGDPITNIWTVEGKESVEIFKKLCVGAEGEHGARKLAPGSDASKPDEQVPLKVQPGQKVSQWWIGRRAVPEHALLEDCGQPAGASALRDGYPGYESLNGVKPGEPGSLARRVVLGKPALVESPVQ